MNIINGKAIQPIHVSQHEDGGWDEIDLTDLSGGSGTPYAHKTSHQNGGSDEISLAGLSIDAHKTSHQDGGSDELSIAGLVGKTNFVERGDDPVGNDFVVGDLTTDGTWRDLDLSSLIPAGTKLVMVKIVIADVSVANQFIMRKNGQSNQVDSESTYTQIANVTRSKTVLVVPDANRVIEYWATNDTWNVINIAIRGWWT